MNIPDPTQRPDRKYWETSREQRSKRFDEQSIAIIMVELANYSSQRFVLGREFVLTRALWGIPKGSTCVVTSLWPCTRVKWKDKRFPYELSVSYKLDTS
jgi:hypothetical protein